MAKATGEKLYLLGEADLAILRRMIEAEKRRPQNRVGPGESPGEDNQQSGVFASLPDGETLPARTDNGDDTYTLHGGELQLFRETWVDIDERTLEFTEGWEEYVFNPSNEDIDGPRILYTHLTVMGTRVVVVEPCNTDDGAP